jgi:hypothetical protein
MKNKIFWLLTLFLLFLFIVACNIFARFYGYIFNIELWEAKLEILWGSCCGALYALLSWWYIDTHRK